MRNHFTGNHVRWGIAFWDYETSLIKTDCESTKSSYDSNKKLKSKETIWIFLTSILPTKYLRLFEKL